MCVYALFNSLACYLFLANFVYSLFGIFGSFKTSVIHLLTALVVVCRFTSTTGVVLYFVPFRAGCHNSGGSRSPG